MKRPRRASPAAFDPDSNQPARVFFRGGPFVSFVDVYVWSLVSRLVRVDVARRLVVDRVRGRSISACEISVTLIRASAEDGRVCERASEGDVKSPS